MMTESEYNDIEKISRDYVDNFSFKEMALNEIMPKYFEEELTNMTVGLNGMLTEYTGMIAEDGFNTASTLLLETFPTRASMENSIYSNAAIFQLSNVFSKPARCEFLIVIPESDIIRNFITKQGEPFSYFYIDKDTTIYVEDVPFVLDYDIVIRAIYKETQKGYVYSAKYDMSGYKNSMSTINDPYIKIRKTPNKLIVLQVNMGQYRRKVSYEQIIDNATINFPTINVSYSDKICGCDVLYKEPGESEFKTHLDLQVRYSQPSKDPFCYYRKITDGLIQLSFTTKDTYFQPEFNSELMIVTYTTMGKYGNFDSYNGENISLTKNNDTYQYDYSWAVSEKPLGSSAGGMDALSKSALQDLTVEGFSTANALTTEHDLQLYFNNFKHRYGAEVLFLKKRDDTVERLYSAFLYVKKDDYFYPMNTLSLETNLLYFDEKDGGFFNMDPGMLFTYKDKEIYRVLPIYYVMNHGSRTGEYYDKDGRYHEKNGSPTEDYKELEEIEEDLKAGKLWQNPKQYYSLVNGKYVLFNEDGTKAEAIYKSLDGKTYYVYRDELYYLYDPDMTLKEEFDPVDQITINSLLSSNSIVEERVDVYNDDILLSENQLLYKFRNGEVTFDTIENPGEKYVDFLFDSEKELKAKLNYLDYFDVYKNENGNDLMTISEYIFKYSFKDYKKDNNIDNRLTVFDPNISEIAKKHKFLFTNPFLLSITKSCGLVGFYMTAVDQTSTLDFINENDPDAFTQFITYNLKVNRDISNTKKYTFELTTMPSVSIDTDYGVVDDTTVFDETNDSQFPETIDDFKERDLMSYDRSLLSKNNLRVILSFYDENDEELLAYMEMIPVENDKTTEQVTFKAEFITDDYVTTDDVFRVTHRCPYCGTVIDNSVNTEKRIFTGKYTCSNITCKNGIKGFNDGIINIREIDDILLPITNATVHVTTLYRDPKESVNPTNNEFVEFNESYEGYHWTNIYSTVMEPITFIQPMNLLRTNIEYMDYYTKGIDALDCHVYDIPLVKYSLIAYKDQGPAVTETTEIDDIQKFQYFLKSYTNHYKILKEAKELLRNNTNIDTKFYNTYGRSTNFVIGEGSELIDTVNIRIYFDVWLIPNTDKTYAETTLKTFIKEYVESINVEGTNDLYISNLIREIENNMAFVHHLKFKGINDYDTSYQAIKNRAIKLTELSKEERRHFVPDLLTVNRANIILSFEEIT